MNVIWDALLTMTSQEHAAIYISMDISIDASQNCHHISYSASVYGCLASLHPHTRVFLIQRYSIGIMYMSIS